MGDLTKQAQLLKKCVKLAVYIRSGREFVSILTMQPNNVLEKGAFFGRVSEQGKQYMIRRMIVKIRSNLTAFHIEMEEQSFVIVDLNAVMTYVSRKQKEIAAGQLAGTVADNNCPLAFITMPSIQKGKMRSGWMFVVFSLPRLIMFGEPSSKYQFICPFCP